MSDLHNLISFDHYLYKALKRLGSDVKHVWVATEYYYERGAKYVITLAYGTKENIFEEFSLDATTYVFKTDTTTAKYIDQHPYLEHACQFTKAVLAYHLPHVEVTIEPLCPSYLNIKSQAENDAKRRDAVSDDIVKILVAEEDYVVNERGDFFVCKSIHKERATSFLPGKVLSYADTVLRNLRNNFTQGERIRQMSNYELPHFVSMIIKKRLVASIRRKHKAQNLKDVYAYLLENPDLAKYTNPLLPQI